MTKEVSTATRPHHSSEDRKRAAEAYYLTRSSIKASQVCGVPASTIRKWKLEGESWKTDMALVQEHYNEQMDGKLTAILVKTADGILERIEEGDAKVTPQGDIVYTPIQAKELASIQKQAFDQRQVLRGGDLTSKQKSFSLEELKAVFEATAHAAKMTSERVINPREGDSDEQV